MTKPKTKISKKEIENIAELIMVRLRKEEKSMLPKQLRIILKYAEQLDDINTSKLKETSQVTGLKNILRDDKVKRSLTQKEALSNAAFVEGGFFKVPGKLYL